MYFDSLTTAAVADEVREKALGGRVQRIVQVDSLSLGIEIFAAGEGRDWSAWSSPHLNGCCTSPSLGWKGRLYC